MTVTVNDRKITYSGNGATTVFPYDFPIAADTEIQVILVDSLDVPVVKTLTIDYTVSGVGVVSGGNVTFVTAPATGYTVVLRGNTPLTQVTDYVERDAFPAETHEAALDKLTKQQQELVTSLQDYASGTDRKSVV